MSETTQYIKMWRKPVSNIYEENYRIMTCDLNRFVCKCKFEMDIRCRCSPYKLSYGQNDDDSDNEDYREYKKFIETSFQTCPYKLQCALYFINDDAHACHINQEDEEELISFISSYEELFSLNENEIQTLYKMMILDNNNYYYHSMEEIDEVYQKYLSEKDASEEDNDD